jgi:hypothetical protein
MLDANTTQLIAHDFRDLLANPFEALVEGGGASD